MLKSIEILENYAGLYETYWRYVGTHNSYLLLSKKLPVK